MDQPTSPTLTQKGTESSSSLVAPIQTFHLFPFLPPELRTMIWKAACFPRSTTNCGLHHVTLDEIEEDLREDGGLGREPEDFDDLFSYVKLRALQRPGDDPIRGTTSSYLWDAGLWTASRESRHVITGHLDLDNWKLVQSQPRAEWIDESFPMRLRPHDRDEKLITMVFPRDDIFCVTHDNPPLPRLLPGTLFDMSVEGPSIDGREQVPIGTWNMAFEFHCSWINDFPESHSEISSEFSIRGLICWWAKEFLDEPDLHPNIWLIDPNVHWISLPDLEYETVYRSCDAEYLHVSWEALVAAGEKPAVLKFVEKLGSISDDFDDEHEPKRAIKLLARKDNKLSDGSATDTLTT